MADLDSGFWTRLSIAALAVAMAGWALAVHWPKDEGTGPPPLAITASDASRAGGGDASSLQERDAAAVADELSVTRAAYCRDNNGMALGSASDFCDFDLCAPAGQQPCGVKRIVCDDVPDAFQCGWMHVGEKEAAR